MDAAERKLRQILKKRAKLIRITGHEVYELDNGKRIALRGTNKRGHQDHWKSALSFLKRKLREAS